MSDGDVPRPTMGGKSLETAMASARAPYKSWRKKFRKMRVKFDAVLEENKKLFKEEQKLEGLARRLTEELDGLMEILLDLNQSSAIPSDLRFDVTLPQSQRPSREVTEYPNIPADLQPEQANDIMKEYISAVQSGRLAALDMHVVRLHMQEQLAQQGMKPLPEPDVDFRDAASTKDNDPEGNPSFLSAEQEDAYLARVDALAPDQSRTTAQEPLQPNHQAELTPRELERQMEVLNPQSQHNWLRSHSKTHPMVDDNDETLMGHEQISKSTKKRPSGKNLARSMMDRMVREGFSPSEMSGAGGDDEQDEANVKRKGLDKDPSYRSKVAKNGGAGGGGAGGGSTKSKRKRTTDDGPGGKRLRASEIFE